MTEEDLIESMEYSSRFHEQLLNTISIAYHLLRMNYHQIMNLPLKDFYTLLRIRSEEEREKNEYLKQQQQSAMQNINSSNKRIKY